MFSLSKDFTSLGDTGQSPAAVLALQKARFLQDTCFLCPSQLTWTNQERLHDVDLCNHRTSPQCSSLLLTVSSCSHGALKHWAQFCLSQRTPCGETGKFLEPLPAPLFKKEKKAYPIKLLPSEHKNSISVLRAKLLSLNNSGKLVFVNAITC